MNQLRKRLTLWGLTMIAVGSCIGSGIFLTPYKIVEALPHHGFVLLVWAVGGLIALTGALTFAELGSMFPKAGGVYVFLREAYGELTGFLYGWVILLVVNTGALAALGVGFALYMSFFLPDLSANAQLGLAVGTIAGLTAINCVGVQFSQGMAKLFTGLKLAAIAGIILVGILYYEPQAVNLHFSLSDDRPAHLFSALLVALIGVLWSFGGWHHATYVAGEAIDPQRTVPRAMILGALIVTVTYVLVNLAYMMLLPLPDIAGSQRVAGDAVATIFPWGGKAVAIGIAVSIFGTIAIYTMSAPRIYFAMARDGLFFSQLAYVHPRLQTPINAMIVQAVWAVILLLFWGTFEDLITYVTFMDIVFMTMTGAAVFWFRYRRPEHPRPYRTWGYPVTPLIFVAISGAFVLNTFLERPAQAWAGLILLGTGIFVYLFFRIQKRKTHAKTN